ncbi:hypothetical protein [Aeoliella sp. SH292]|uniref:hypothetical protein n=1 Tax=Aeoliella sp. SH292 TaxID=3454464 RepID=UPI003F9D9B06
MARDEHERENLLGDATAYVRRVEFRDAEGQEVFVGFRTNGAASVYLDQDPVYHFTSEGELRRAYVAGELIKSVRGQLVAMHRERTPGEVQLVSRPLDEVTSKAFLVNMESQLTRLADSLRNEKLIVVGSVPADVDVEAEVPAWLETLLASEMVIANAPNAR